MNYDLKKFNRFVRALQSHRLQPGDDYDLVHLKSKQCTIFGDGDFWYTVNATVLPNFHSEICIVGKKKYIQRDVEYLFSYLCTPIATVPDRDGHLYLNTRYDYLTAMTLCSVLMERNPAFVYYRHLNYRVFVAA